MFMSTTKPILSIVFNLHYNYVCMSKKLTLEQFIAVVIFGWTSISELITKIKIDSRFVVKDQTQP